MNNDFYSKVFLWLFVGLLATFGTGALVLYNPSMLKFVFSNSNYWIIIILQVVLCLFLSIRIHKMSSQVAKITYVGYCCLTGLTFSSIFFVFALNSIIFVFAVTAILFGIFALIGKMTKIDLSKLHVYLFIGLLGIIILEIVNRFLMNNSLDMTLCIISIVVFLGYIAYDMQNVRRMIEAEATTDNMAIIAAFQLYLDFINLFLDLLRLFAKERD